MQVWEGKFCRLQYRTYRCVSLLAAVAYTPQSCVPPNERLGEDFTCSVHIAIYNLPIVIIVVNNNGIYNGFDEASWANMLQAGDPTSVAPPVSLKPNARYEQVMMAFGGKGYFVNTPEELQKALTSSFADKNVPSLINVMIDPQSDRKEQEFPWLTRSNL
ncbi:unnamed protein product [Ranitomeya imitator]|uniref:2-hydroxyacyl-CoA lyase n=1 Tax=Ranitomeya imitator TaxID=111125 RepID=A0ABN9KXZ5_9NEOB|nr:unnamed protein product [Ranitomeya imitator]